MFLLIHRKRQKLSKGKAAKTPKKDHSNTPTEKSCSKNSSSESLDVDTSSSSVSVESSTVSISSPSGAMVAPVVHIVNELLNTKTKPTIDTTEGILCCRSLFFPLTVGLWIL